MTVIIRDLEKPSSCWECQDKFCIKDENGRYYCAVDGEYIDFKDGEINLDCPLEEYEGDKWQTGEMIR